MGDVSGFNSRRQHFISVCNQPTRSTQPFILSRLINWVVSCNRICVSSHGRRHLVKAYDSLTIWIEVLFGFKMCLVQRGWELYWRGTFFFFFFFSFCVITLFCSSNFSETTVYISVVHTLLEPSWPVDATFWGFRWNCIPGVKLQGIWWNSIITPSGE